MGNYNYWETLNVQISNQDGLFHCAVLNEVNALARFFYQKIYAYATTMLMAGCQSFSL